MKKPRFYKPQWELIVLDLVIWTLATLIMVLWRTLTDKSRHVDYCLVCTALFVANLIFGYCFNKYRFLRDHGYFYNMKGTTLTFVVLILGLVAGFYINELGGLSSYVLIMTVVIAFAFNVGFLFFYYGYRYALNMDEGIMEFNLRPPTPLAVTPQCLKPQAEEAIKQSILDFADRKTLNFLSTNCDLGSSTTLVLATSTLFNIQSLENYNYNCIINLKRLNDMRGVNKMFCAINEKLPDGGLFVCRFKPHKATKVAILRKYPKGINKLMYSFYFIHKRILPKLFLTSRLYYDITKGRNRVFSTTEVLGRLYFCGFKIIKEKVLGDTYMVIAQREKQPEKQVKRKYGLFIKLPRIGKNKKKFNVYKLRTMHPYSEFLQAYMYEKHHLQKGGKISNDIRVSTWGRFLRKYWLDEVPMLINLLKGDMKIVGVRPLSAHFFSLYSKELQDKRTQFKPGLLPPFYADMPKTLEEIQNSEMCYLNACEQKGVFRTDWVYFWRIIYNIIFKRARSK
ncbi:MAG TPA: sugar transferase [Paludibacteraceae bacterium]|nr:sugar transferase [Paludibacteraceae bacterium]